MNAGVLIPAYNEGRHIGDLVARVQATGYPALVIDDGSKDDTAKAARHAGAEVIILDSNQGKGAAIQVGFDWALERNFEAALILDGDGQHDPAEIGRFIEAAQEEQVQLVLGNRLANPAGMPLIRLWTNRFMSWVLSRMCGQNLPDSQCGYRLVKRKVLEKIRLNYLRYDSDSELLMRIARKGWIIASVPVRSIYAGSKSEINPVIDTLRWFRLLWRLSRTP
ncbi:MAG: glycosyltransferase family 2 protein [Candidatus Omnitrophica bacterium]|nr:glycosyltransferase family 2 protein [Candidatus Omnitrophota bacterium]